MSEALAEPISPASLDELNKHISENWDEAQRLHRDSGETEEEKKHLEAHYNQWGGTEAYKKQAMISHLDLRTQPQGLAKPEAAVAPLSSLPSLSPCLSSVISFGVATVGLFLGMMKIPNSVAESAARTLFREMGQETLNGFSRAIIAISESNGISKAKAVISFLGQVKNAVGAKALWSAIKSNMSTYDWIKSGATIIAQLAAFFATDGLAFVGEVTLVILNSVDWGRALASVVTDCK